MTPAHGSIEITERIYARADINARKRAAKMLDKLLGYEGKDKVEEIPDIETIVRKIFEL